MGKLSQAAILVSNNPAAYGVVRAQEVAGHKSVNTKKELLALPAGVLKVDTDSGASTSLDNGQHWWVEDEKCFYRLMNYTKPGVEASWEKVEDVNKVATLAASLQNARGAADGLATLGSDRKLTASQLPALKTVNGTSLVGSGDVKIDLSLYKVVESLPSTGIDENKIYLVLSATGGESNKYTEYVHASGAWEKLGEYKADVDLTPYLKSADLVALTDDEISAILNG